MSWSEGRDSKKESEPASRRVEKLGYVNGALQKLSEDEDLHDELKLKIVQVAIDHWTGKKRLPPEESKRFQDNRSCIYVLQRLQMLRHAAEMAGIASPVDHMLGRKKKLDLKYVLQYFGSDIFEVSGFPKELYAEEFKKLREELRKRKEDKEGKAEDGFILKSVDSTSSLNENMNATKESAKDTEPTGKSRADGVKTDQMNERPSDIVKEEEKMPPVFSWSNILIQFVIMIVLGVSMAYVAKYQDNLL
jgi:hypothetical protein